jgi:hypothetical protein
MVSYSSLFCTMNELYDDIVFVTLNQQKMHLTLWTRFVGHQALLLRQEDMVRPQVNKLHQMG